jgi:hypothetical protein
MVDERRCLREFRRYGTANLRPMGGDHGLFANAEFCDLRLLLDAFFDQFGKGRAFHGCLFGRRGQQRVDLCRQ